jgi:CspA family cold shock protein
MKAQGSPLVAGPKTCPALRGAKVEGEWTMPNGTVKWFNTTKGYGFIAPDDGGADIFVHISAVEQSGMTGLADDQKVTFDLIEGRDGRKMAGNLAVQD